MTDSYDPWELETGLLAEFDAVVDACYFATDAAYNDGATLLLNLDVTIPELGESNLRYPCGSGWEAADSGKRAIREDGGDRRTFNKKSGVGLLVQAAVDCGAGDVLRSRGTPLEATIWEGLRFHFKRVKINEGTQYETERPLPVAYLQGDSAPLATPQEQGSAVAAPSSGNKVAVAKLRNLAKKSNTHDEFIEAGLELADGDSELEAMVADPDWYEAARS